MSKFKKSYLLLLVSAAMNIGNVYASEEVDDDTTSHTALSSSPAPAPTTIAFPIKHGAFVLKISDDTSDYTVAAPGRTGASGVVAAILDSTFNELRLSNVVVNNVPNVLSKLMGEYEYTPSLFCYLYKSSKIVRAINSETGEKVVDIQLDYEPNFAIHFGASLFVFESFGGISVISTITNPPIKYYFEFLYTNPRNFTLMGDKVSVDSDSGTYLINLDGMEKHLASYLGYLGFSAKMNPITTTSSSASSSSSSTNDINNTNNNG